MSFSCVYLYVCTNVYVYYNFSLCFEVIIGVTCVKIAAVLMLGLQHL